MPKSLHQLVPLQATVMRLYDHRTRGAWALCCTAAAAAVPPYQSHRRRWVGAKLRACNTKFLAEQWLLHLSSNVL